MTPLEGTGGAPAFTWAVMQARRQPALGLLRKPAGSLAPAWPCACSQLEPPERAACRPA